MLRASVSYASGNNRMEGGRCASVLFYVIEQRGQTASVTLSIRMGGVTATHPLTAIVCVHVCVHVCVLQNMFICNSHHCICLLTSYLYYFVILKVIIINSKSYDGNIYCCQILSNIAFSNVIHILNL